MRKFLLSAAAAALFAACSPPAQREAEDRPTTPPTVLACNTVAPEPSRQVGIEDETATAAAASDLRGGRIAPGVYDLVRAMRVGAATGWRGTRAIALEVAEDASGAVIFNWAGAAPGGETDRWTATFTEAPQPRLTYTCGRIGELDAGFTAEADALQLRLPDGAAGSLLLSFQRRP
jgi:hypothetical protein